MVNECWSAGEHAQTFEIFIFVDAVFFKLIYSSKRVRPGKEFLHSQGHSKKERLCGYIYIGTYSNSSEHDKNF